MKTIFRPLGLMLLLCVIPNLIQAQEVLTGFYHKTPAESVGSRDIHVQTLPFMDDFSNSRIYPDSTKWIDRNAYVSSGFPIHPVTRNAATLDVLDAEGRVYNYAISNSFIAEHLTSTTIRLDSVFEPTPKALTPADSLYLSFFYQPQGNGNPPEAQDSLVLEFGIPREFDTVWHHIWSTPGMTLSKFLQENDSMFFKQVMIPITDTAFFKPNFLFRFYNYASIANISDPNSRGNEDNWNIDFVYLNYNRNITDTSYPIICFASAAPSFLKKYQSMPYKHYRANPTSSIARDVEIQVSNLDNVPHTVDNWYTVRQISGTQEYSYTNEDIALSQQELNKPSSLMVYDLFALNYNCDSTSFLIRHYISDATCTPPLIDSMDYHQGFYNYFAYDDGTPEMGYGVNPSDGAFAVRFELSEMDTLRGVQFLFNHTLNDANNDYFDIVVWKDNNGKPGDEVYRLSNRKPKWENRIYQFAYYKFDRIIKLNGVFYIGIEQQSNGIINIGFDTSLDNSQYNFYNVTGSWQQSSKAGSIMMRPVVGSSYYIGVDETLLSNAVTVYPNPVSSTLHVNGVENGLSIAIYDLTGRKVMQESYSDEISIAHLSDGLYLLNITTTDGMVINKKIMVRQ